MLTLANVHTNSYIYIYIFEGQASRSLKIWLSTPNLSNSQLADALKKIVETKATPGINSNVWLRAWIGNPLCFQAQIRVLPTTPFVMVLQNEPPTPGIGSGGVGWTRVPPFETHLNNHASSLHRRRLIIMSVLFYLKVIVRRRVAFTWQYIIPTRVHS